MNKLIRMAIGLAAAIVLAATAMMVSGAGPAYAQTIEAKALDDHDCDTSEWHFVINQISDPSLAPAYITVVWDNQSGQPNVSVENVPLWKVTGKTAHYITTILLGSTVVSASATIYDEWDGQFNLSHGPCEESTPTPIPTPIPTLTPTPTPTPTLTPTPIPTPTPMPTPTPTSTPTPTPEPTPSPTPSPTPELTPSPTPEPTVTPTPMPTITPGPTVTPTPMPTVTPVVTPTPMPTIEPTPIPRSEVTPVATSIYAPPSLDIPVTFPNTGGGGMIGSEGVNVRLLVIFGLAAVAWTVAMFVLCRCRQR